MISKLMPYSMEKNILSQELERQEVDHQFEAMAEDDEYQVLNQQLSEAFSDSDWEALMEGESGYSHF